MIVELLRSGIVLGKTCLPLNSKLGLQTCLLTPKLKLFRGQHKHNTFLNLGSPVMREHREKNETVKNSESF